MEKEFLHRRSFKNVWIFFLVFGVFFVIGLIFLSGAMDGVGKTSGKLIYVTQSIGISSQRIVGLGFAGFSAFALAIFSWKSFSKRPLYIIRENQIVIRPVGIFPNEKVFNFSEIQSVEKISGKEVEDITTRLMQDAEWDKWTLQLPSLVRNEMKFMKLIQYCSVPITIEKVSVGSGGGVGVPVYLKTQTDGDFVFLSLKSGERYLLSPKNIDEFIGLLG
jgi:hypothetical protein